MTTGTRVKLAMDKAKTYWTAKSIERLAGRTGEIVGYWRDGECVRVQWDDIVDAHVIHPKYLEVA